MRPVVEAATATDDVVTADLLTSFMEQQEKDLWMLRAMLRGRQNRDATTRDALQARTGSVSYCARQKPHQLTNFGSLRGVDHV